MTTADGFTLTLAEVARAIGATVPPPWTVAALEALRPAGVSTDTRTLRPGELFVALRGPRTDGHAFLPEAFARGAAGAVAARLPDGPAGGPVLLVADTLRALGAIAAAHRRRLGARVVGVTGSVGKTTTVALTAAVAESRFRTVRSEEAWNAEVGVPLTLLRATPATEVVVVEMAMRGRGQIAELVEVARPQVGVVTTIGESHLELLGSVEAIAEAKGELVAGLPADGVAVLNADDPWSSRLAELAGTRRVVWYGMTERARVRASHVAHAAVGTRFRLHVSGEGRQVPAGSEQREDTGVAAARGDAEVEVALPLLGRHNVGNALAAAAVGVVLGVDPEAIARALGQAAPPHMRLEVEQVGDLVLVNDAYNASPQSVRAAFEVVARLAPGRRRVLVLGDMKELGPASPALHEQVGREAAALDPAVLVAVGPEAAALAVGARRQLAAARVLHVADADAAAALLPDLVRPGDVVLVKGSRAMALERVVAALRRARAPSAPA